MENVTAKLTDWIIERLDEKGWSARELARRANLSHATIYGVLTERANPGTDFCTGIARAFKIPPERVFRMARLLPPVATGKDAEKRFQECAEYFQYLPLEDQERLVDIARTFYERRAEHQAGEKK